MAHWAWDEGKAPTGLARVGVLHPLEREFHINNIIMDTIRNLCLQKVTPDLTERPTAQSLGKY